MKSEFLKIAGVKSDKAFYKKYPTEAAFFKAHPEAKKSIKKAQAGISSAMSSFTQNMQSIPDMQNIMQGQMQSPGVNAGMFPSGNQPQASGPMNAPGSYNSWDIDNNGIPDTIQQQQGNPLNTAAPGATPKKPNFGDQLSKMAGPAGKVIGGIQAIREGRRKRKEAEMFANVTGLQADAAESTDVDALRQYTENAERKRRAFMPEMTGEEFFPVYGVGTNVLARNGARLEYGGMVGGNPTEIQNTYGDGNSLYDDLEYEPLYNVDQIKSYQSGGDISGMLSSMGGGAGGGTPWGAIGGLGSQGAASLTGNDGGGQVGGAIGGAAGMAIGGPAGEAIGQTVGTLAGGLLDTNDRDQRKAEEKIKNNMNRMIASQFTTDYLHPKFGSNLRNGGYMNPEYNPQVIAKFGELDAQDYAEFAKKDQFRAGGHLKAYREPSERAMQTYDMGGELQTHWGGYAEPMSYNPYMPGSGETVVFRGQSHTDSDGKGNTGIGITYGENPVEVERGEPMFEMQSGGNINPETGEPENTGVVFGNMQINKKVAGELNDPELMKIANMYHGKKFKNVGIDLSKQEVKQNKIISKNTDILNSFKVESSIDKAKLAGLQANIEGAKSNLKNIANTKITLANFQNSINDAKEEMSESFGQNISAEDLAKGYIKLDKDPVTMNAKWGGDIVKKAKDGDKVKTFKSEREANAAGYRKGADGKYYRTVKKFSTKDEENESADALEYVPAGQKQSNSGLWGKVTPEEFEAAKQANAWYPGWSTFNPKSKVDVENYQKAFNARAKEVGSSKRINVDGDFGEQTVTARVEQSKKTEPIVTEEQLTANVEEPEYTPMEEERAQFPWLGVANQGLRYLVPTDQEELNPNQLMGEMYAMSSNQLEPVQAQPYSPQLRVPFDISRQAAKNDLIAQTRGAQRLVGYNPAAQASIAAQAYNPMQQLNEQDFIDNQRMKDAVYSGNIQTLNDAELKNLSIYDQKYTRQEQVRSNTKATSQAVLNSISDKYAKNALENRKLSIYENMYPNFRFGKDGRAQNYGLQFFDTKMSGSKGSSNGDMEGLEATRWDKNGTPISWKKASDKNTVDDDALEAVGGIKGKNGTSTKKNYKNSSVVRAFKNL
jgi:hypothetical protein